MIKKFKVNVSKKTLINIYKKIRKFPFNNIQNMDGWLHGTNHDYLKNISKYWISKFNWKLQERKINKFNNFIANVNGNKIDFIKEKGSGKNPKPLLILHGWPGSFIEFLSIIEKLAHPERFGGNKEDGFDVIVPSLPGFGFSGIPKKPIGPKKIAKIMNEFMTKNLGYKKYFAQGGDWGSAVCNWLGHDHHKYCKAIHVNCLNMRHPKGALTNEEKKWEKRFFNEQIMQEGYRTQQATKPQSLSYAMIDSPVGTAAWILEKFYSWSDLKNGNIEKIYTKDFLLTNIMIYIITNTFNSAAWIYFGRREEGGRPFPKNFKKIRVPTAIAEFPKEMLSWPPKSYVNRIFNVKRWTKMKKGGHFAALEEPDMLVNDICSFFNKDLKKL